MITVVLKPRLTHEVLIQSKSNVDIERMCKWCQEQFGIRFSIVERLTFGQHGVWQCIYDGRGRDHAVYKFSFDHEQDAVLFALKWMK
jgi:hypothetical protein